MGEVPGFVLEYGDIVLFQEFESFLVCGSKKIFFVLFHSEI